MERLSADIFHIRVVEIIACQRIAQMFHVDADLVGAPCFKNKGDETVSIFICQKLVMGYGTFSVDGIHSPLDDGSGFPCERGVDGAGLWRNMPAGDGKIFPVYLVAAGHGGKDAGAHQMLGNHGKS